MKKPAKPFIAFVVLCLLAVGTYGLLRYHNYKLFTEKPFPDEKGVIVLTIPQGSSFRKVAGILHGASVISDPVTFRMMARIEKTDKDVQAGEYAFLTPITPRKVMETLVAGSVHLYSLTIPEGRNLYQIAAAVEKAGIGSKEGFLKMAFSKKTAREFGIEAESLEGYLFPDTYRFSAETTQEALVSMMVARFNKVFNKDWRNRAKEMGLTPHQVITLASIVEKETGAAKERTRIASVFHNRLKKGMRLQADPTVIYGIGKSFDGNITRKHLRQHTPYNTYVIKGLPPGPICSPGEAALKAALWPEDTNYLYFVSRNNGTHFFSATYKEHAKAVRHFQIQRNK